MIGRPEGRTDWEQTLLPKEWATEQETPGCLASWWPVAMAFVMAGIVIVMLW